MAKILVLYYSSWGHMEAMAHAAAEGARSVVTEVDVRRVPELVPLEVAKAAYFSSSISPLWSPIRLIWRTMTGSFSGSRRATG